MKPEAIVDLFNTRRRQGGNERERMRQMCALYQGDIAVPLPELKGYDRPAVINFARMGINHMGMRVAGLLPVIEHVPVDYGHREPARKRADDRRKVGHGWWGHNKLKLILRQRARWYFAYASAPVMIRPDFTTGMPRWEPRSPLDTYASHIAGVTEFCPRDSIFAQTRTVGWLRENHPEQAATFFQKQHVDDLVDILEYNDAEEWHLVATLTSRRPSEMTDSMRGGAMPWMESHNSSGVTLRRVPNRAGEPWTIIAGNISLERRTSNYDGMIGMYQAQAKLQALGLIAKQRSVFQTEYLIATNPNVAPSIKRPADPDAGIIGIIEAGTIDRHTPDPQYANDQSIDRLERSQRVEAGVPASFGGEAASNVRTGKTLSGLVDDSVQPSIAEAHDIFEASLHAENCKAIAIDKAYWRGESKTIFVAFNGDKCRVTYTPDTLWETSEHLVRYPFAGADVADVNIATGQAMGAGLMSKATAGRLNPLIENAEVEHDQIIYEQLEQGLLQQILAEATTPGTPGMTLIDHAEMIKKVRDDEIELVDAVIAQQRAAQERQTTPAPDAAAAAPGMAAPGVGAEQPKQFTTAPGQDQLSSLLYSLRAPQMQTAAERGTA